MLTRKSDRRGYLGYKTALDNGNEALNQHSAGLWWKESPPVTEIGYYSDLYLTEGFIDKHLGTTKTYAANQAAKRIDGIQSPSLRQKVGHQIDRLTSPWNSVKSRVHTRHQDTLEARLKAGHTHRQLINPSENDGQAWFHVKRDLETSHLDRLEKLEAKLERAIDRRIGRALGTEAKDRAVGALDSARQLRNLYEARQSGTRHKDHDHERQVKARCRELAERIHPHEGPYPQAIRSLPTSKSGMAACM
jgi:hypothetical protein